MNHALAVVIVLSNTRAFINPSTFVLLRERRSNTKELNCFDLYFRSFYHFKVKGQHEAIRASLASNFSDLFEIRFEIRLSKILLIFV